MKRPEQRRVNISGINVEKKTLRLIVYVDTVMLFMIAPCINNIKNTFYCSSWCTPL